MHEQVHVNVPAGKGGADLNNFTYCWVACEFPFGHVSYFKLNTDLAFPERGVPPTQMCEGNF